MEDNLGNNMPQVTEPTQAPFAAPKPPKKWYRHKGIIIIIVLAFLTVLVSWLALSRHPKTENNLVLQKDATADWQVYADKENDFSLKYPADLYFVPDRYYSQASSTGEFSIQSVPAPQLFKYYYNENNQLNVDYRPYHRNGFIIEVQPSEGLGPESEVKDITRNLANSNECKMEEMVLIDVSGVKSYKYVLTGEDAGDITVVVPYSVGENIKLHFKTSFTLGSSEYKKALQTFEQILTTFKFTNVTPLSEFEEARAKEISEITWKKYTNPFLEFEYSSDFELGNEKVITEHTLSPSSGNDLYGFVGLTLQNDLLHNASLNITALPNRTNLGEDQLYKDQELFVKEEPDDSFEIITIDGYKASVETRPFINEFDLNTCGGVSRLGNKIVKFYSKQYVYELQLTWITEYSNALDSQLQKEFQRFVSSFNLVETK